jgi:hypothetical protein
MRKRADIKCYHCGEVSGIWEWPSHAPPAVGVFRSAASQHPTIVALGHLRCARCQGSVYLDEVETVVPRCPIVLQPGRRGRPRKLPRLAS